MLKSPIVFLEGGEVYLRPVELDDARRCVRWISDPQTRRWLDSVWPMNMVREEEWIREKYQERRDITLAIVLAEGDRHIGNVGLHAIDLLNGTAVTGMLVGESDCRGKGYGPKAKALLLAYAFNTLNLRVIMADVIDGNDRSRRSLEKSGYREVGRVPGWFFREGRARDKVLFAITREEWEARQAT